MIGLCLIEKFNLSYYLFLLSYSLVKLCFNVSYYIYAYNYFFTNLVEDKLKT